MIDDCKGVGLRQIVIAQSSNVRLIAVMYSVANFMKNLLLLCDTSRLMGDLRQLPLCTSR